MSDIDFTSEQLGFDADALRRKYREERDKRLRPEGNEQYVETAGRHEHYRDDPYVEPGFSRAPLHDEVDAVVVGGGFGGLLSAARLREAGLERIRIIEQGGDFGGTWYWNRYPGAACDVESYIYLPLLEELGYLPGHKFTTSAEIRAHCQAVGKHFDLYRDACFQTRITGMQWDESDARWIITTHRDDRMRARFVVMANGPLNRPKLPGIPGIEQYRGHTFHTSRWDYAYTGGDANGNLEGLKDKRVGIIGTGATAVQCVPHLGASAKHLYVFQRTPSSIDVRNDRPTDPQWAASLKPGWQRERMANFNTLVTGGSADVDMVNDGWTEIFRNLVIMAGSGRQDREAAIRNAQAVEIADFQKMNQIRARVDAVVKDPATAEALKPWYRQFCKRPCFHDDYLPTFNRPNVTLVDTAGKGVEHMTERGVVVAGQEYELDCLIFATGFEVGTGYTRRSGYDLVGRGGQRLSDKWASGIRTLHGLMTGGFPNVFIIATQQAAFTVNIPHAIDEQSRHLAYIVRRTIDQGARTVEPSEQGEADWVQTIVNLGRMGEKFMQECTPGYYNNEGRPGERNRQNLAYGHGSVAYFKVISAWREEGSMVGLSFS